VSGGGQYEGHIKVWQVAIVAGTARPTWPRQFKVGQAVPAIVTANSKSWCVPHRVRVSLAKPQRFVFLFLLLSLLTNFAVCLAEESRGNPAAHVLPGEFASEHWDFTARFDSGHLLFVEFIVTNIGIGDRNAAVFGHIVPPEGNPRRFSNGRTEKYWKLSSDRLRMEVGTSLLDMRAPNYKIQVTKRSVQLDLQLTPAARPLWSPVLAPPGYALDLLALAMPIEGTLWLKGMTAPLQVRGTVTATHSWTNAAGSSLVLRRVEVFCLQEKNSVYGVDITAPDGTQKRWLVVKRPDQAEYMSAHFDLSLTGELKGQRDYGYAVPNVMQIKNAELESQVRLESRVLQADPFVDLPRPFRYLVSLALDLRPRRIWAHSQIELSWQTPAGAVPLQKRSEGITAVTFLNPLPTGLQR
jgi:hypothetical protein